MYPSIEAVLQQHNDLLQAHRRFLDSLKARSKGIANTDEIIRICTMQTKSMVEDFEQCKSKFKINHSVTDAPPPKAPDSPQPRATQAQSVGSNGGKRTINDSGFFMTDTTPTPIEELLHASNSKDKAMPSRAKRKFDENVSDAIEGGDGHKTRSLKKAKVHSKGSLKGGKENLQTASRPRNAVNPPKPGGSEDLRNGSRPRNARSAEQNGARAEDAPETEPVDDSFVREVEEMLAIQEEKKRNKANKKRKRESSGSDAQQVQSSRLEDCDETGAVKPIRKKAKTKNSVAASDGTVSDQSTPLRQATPLSDRTNKRPSPASHYLDSVLRRAKRKKT